jgi:hypothetical protein
MTDQISKRNGIYAAERLKMIKIEQEQLNSLRVELADKSTALSNEQVRQRIYAIEHLKRLKQERQELLGIRAAANA